MFRTLTSTHTLTYMSFGSDCGYFPGVPSGCTPTTGRSPLTYAGPSFSPVKSLSWKIKTKHHYQSLNIKNPAKNEKKLFNSKLNQIIIFIILKNITNNYKSIYKKQKINYINKIKIITDKYPKHKTSTYFHKIEKLSQI